MTRQRSRTHFINSSVSVPEDGDGITQHGIPERKAPSFNLSNSRVCPPTGATHFGQKTTKSAKFCKRARAQEPRVGADSLKLKGEGE
jgi:hypothetical protein